jgi:very-short-patch-repair endonuclease
MKPEQLKGIAHQARWEGPKLLAEYLAYAQHGGMKAGVYGTGQPESELEEAVRDALVARGYQVDCQVGVSGYRIDLAVRDPDAAGRYIVGIECDGATYHSARTVRDRDRIRQMVLESLGWHIVRVGSTGWIREPARATDRLVEHIERVRRGRGAEGVAGGDGLGVACALGIRDKLDFSARSGFVEGSLGETPREQPSATAHGTATQHRSPAEEGMPPRVPCPWGFRRTSRSRGFRDPSSWSRAS